MTASKILKRPVEVFFDETWLRRDGNLVVALGSQLRLSPVAIRSWQRNAAEITDPGLDYWFLHYQIKPGDIVVDIGAGRGEDTLLFSRLVGEKGMVFSFEAQPETFRCLEKSIRYTGIQNVQLIQGAAFSTRTTLEIESQESEAWQANSVMQQGSHKKHATVSVEAFPLDDIEPLQKVSQIDFLKMNIEGAEVAALLGMKDVLRKVRHACIACHDFLGDSNPLMRTRNRCKELLLDAGFQVFELGDDTPPWQRDHLHAIRME